MSTFESGSTDIQYIESCFGEEIEGLFIMNILIITPFYKQDRNIASVRWTNIAQRLSKNHSIIIVTQPLDDDMDMAFSKTTEDGILVARMNQKTTYEKIAVKYFHGATGDDWQTALSSDTSGNPNSVQKESMLRIIKNRVLYASMKAKAKAYAGEIIKKIIPQDMKIDVVISSACPFIEMLFGYELKSLLKCKWISDFRDLPFTVDNCDDTHRMKKMMKNSLKDADAIVTIAPMGKEWLHNNIINDSEKIHVITNGFSLLDRHEAENSPDSTFRIVHTGSLYGGTRRADLLFKAIKKINAEEPKWRFKLLCAGGNNVSFIQAAQQYGLDSIVEDIGFVAREEALKLQGSADVLLVLCRKKVGSLSAKIFEYMLWQKPILCITCGAEKNSEEAGMIENLNLGISAEEAEGETAIDKLAEYLKMQVECKMSHRPLMYNPDNEKIIQYDHDNIAIVIEQLCINLLCTYEEKLK